MIRATLFSFIWLSSSTLTYAEAGLSRAESEKVLQALGSQKLEELKKSRQEETDAKSITIGDKTLRWMEKEFGEAGEGKRSLWISMHGGGSGPPSMNDGQWKNQIGLYKPKEGIYVAPRAPTDTWNMWHEEHIDPLFARLIEDMVAVKGVDPDRVYLMGYSAGGDGVWQVAPRMADRYAAAAMMAGHPNEASLLGLRNLPFAIFMGGEDSAYDRNKIAEAKGGELEFLHKQDRDGYEHLVKIYKGLPHWMDGKDAEALPWMAKHVRKPWPKKIVWYQDDVLHDRFYWLKLPSGTAKAGDKIVASVEANEVSIEGSVPETLTVYLSDELVNLDKPVVIRINGKVVHHDVVKRMDSVIKEALAERPDRSACPTAKVVIQP